MSTSFGVFRHEVARTDLPRKNLNEKTSAYMIVRELGEALQVQVKKAVCWPPPFFLFWIFLSKLVRS